MKPSDLQTFLVATIEAKHNALVVGSPGIGKTHLIHRAAKVAGAADFFLYPSIGDPTDAKGFPFILDGKAEFIPFGELRRVYEAIGGQGRVVLVLDDLGQGTPATQASYMSLLDKLRGLCSVIAATNRRTDKAGVQGVLEPVKSRFHSIVALDPSLDDFCAHLINEGQERYSLSEEAIVDVVAFLRFRPELLCQFNPTADMINGPCPRTWVACGQQITLGLPAHIEFSAIQGAVGETCGGEFVAFKKMRRALPSLDDILRNPDNAEVAFESSVKWAVCTGLAYKATEMNFPAIHRYALKLYEAGFGQFSALLVRDCTQRVPSIMETPEFQKLCGGKIGDLITGNFS